MTRRRAVLRRPPRGDDGGFTLVEVVVAMAVFAVVVTTTLGILVRTTDVARSNTRRVTAANLANQQVESARSQRAVDIPDGLVSSTVVVDGVTYTVKQTSNYVANAASTSLCQGSGSTLAYKLVTVKVTWPQMGAVKAVRADTLKSLGIGDDGLDADLGTLAVSVTGARSNALDGVLVTLSPGGRQVTTGTDGCAVFTGLTPGVYTAAVNQAGYVASTAAVAGSVGNLSVTAGGVVRGTMLYDEARTMKVALSAAAPYSPPTGLQLSLRNSYRNDRPFPYCSATSGQSCVDAVPGSITTLFPATYDVRAGTCSDATAVASVDVTDPSADGATATLTVARAHVDVTNLLGSQLPGRTVYAIHAAESVPIGAIGCATGETYTLPATTGTGLDVALPVGTWIFSLSSTGGLGSVTATLGSSTVSSVTLVTAL